jgi:hypothetical protein
MTPRLGVVALVAAIAICAGATATAQVQPGVRARVRLKASTTLVGMVDTVRNDSLRLRLTAANIVAVPLDDIDRLEVHAGRHSYGTTGAEIGGALGVVAGMLIALGTQEHCNTGFLSGVCEMGNGMKAVAAIPLGALGGGGVGWLIGSAFHGDRWATVPVSSLRIAPVTLNRVGIGLSLRL